MTIPPIPDVPPQGDTDWYDHYAAIDSNAKDLIQKLQAVIASIPVDAGGNIVPKTGSAYLVRTPNGSMRKLAVDDSGVATWPLVSGSNPVPGGDPNPGTDPTLIYTLATIGAQDHVIDGVNEYRDADHLTLYTYAATSAGQYGPGPSTPTNMYGVEVVINGTSGSGTVASVNNRIASSNQVTTTIPPGKRVLSGHGQGGTTSGQWLLDYATVGATVDFSVGVEVEPDPPPPTPATGVMPTKVVAMWHHRWSGPYLRNYPSDVKGIVNHYILGLAQSAGAGTGSIEYTSLNGQSNADHAADIRALVASGKNVCLGFGGSKANIQVTNNTQADQLVASTIALQAQFGFNGIDVDLEPSGANWTEQALLRAFTALKARFGSGFICGLTPSLYAEHTAKWLSCARLLGNNYDYFAPMLYDIPEAGDSRITSVSLSKMATMIAGGVPANKCILGYMPLPFVGYPTAGMTNATPTMNLLVNAWNAVEAQYPTARGVFCWEDKIEAAGGAAGIPWQFSRTVGPVVKT